MRSQKLVQPLRHPVIECRHIAHLSRLCTSPAVFRAELRMIGPVFRHHIPDHTVLVVFMGSISIFQSLGLLGIQKCRKLFHPVQHRSFSSYFFQGVVRSRPCPSQRGYIEILHRNILHFFRQKLCFPMTFLCKGIDRIIGIPVSDQQQFHLFFTSFLLNSAALGQSSFLSYHKPLFLKNNNSAWLP